MEVLSLITAAVRLDTRRRFRGQWIFPTRNSLKPLVYRWYGRKTFQPPVDSTTKNVGSKPKYLNFFLWVRSVLPS